MSDYDDTNRGALFKNDKEGNEKRPDYTGTINIDGTDKRLAAWLRKSKKGVPYLSLSVSDPQPKGEYQGGGQQSATDGGFGDSEIPF